MTRTKSTKRALLLSALSLLACVSMLIGSTFAWFTDSVESLNNKIVSGNLDVEMYNALQNDLTDDTKVKDAGLFEEITYWEPGVVAYENLTIANEGTLALRYALNINFDNENTLNGYGLSDKLQVAFVPGGLADGLSRDAVVAAANKAGLDPMESFNKEGKLLPEKHDHITMIDKTDIPAKYVTYAIVIYWEPSADDNNWNANNGQTTSDGKALHIDLGVNLFATQLVAENDSFGPDYDTEAQYLIQAGQTESFENETLAGEVQNNGTVTITGAEMINAGPVLRNNGDATVKDTTMKNEGATNYLSYSSGENSVTVFENVDATSNGGGLDIRDGEAIFKSGSVTTNSTATGSRHVFYVAGAKLTIEDGNFTFNPTNLTRKGFYVGAYNGSEVIIKGGNFGKPSTRSSSSASTNYKTGFYADSTSSITIYGGTFKFDPTNWVADGYIATKDADGTYTVVKGATVATVTDLKDAIAAGGNIVLTNDIELTGTLTANKDAVIDLNGKKMTVPSSGAIFQSQSNAAPDMIITSSVAGAEINVSGGDTAVLLGYGSTVINNVTINVNGCDNASPNPFKAYGDLTLGEGTVVNVDYLGTALISNNGAAAIVIDGAKINIGTFKTNGTAVISLNNATTLKVKDTEITIGNFVLSAFGGDSLVSKVDGVTIENCTFDVTDSNNASCTFVAKDGKYRLVQE